MNLLILLCAHLIYAVHAAPQFVSFKDGKVGVNFGGFHAEAGLGGILTGNAAHGGLSASAGTPWGQNAAAGLGGVSDGRSSGFAYAGAQAIPSVGASAVLGGTTGEHGFAGSEAHVNGKVNSNSISIENGNFEKRHEPQSNPPVTSAPTPSAPIDAIQKIKPSKKYSLFKAEGTNPSSAPTPPSQQEFRISNDNMQRVSVDDATNRPVSQSNSNNPTVMINIHRQRMRQRRRQQQQQEVIEEFQKKRTHQKRLQGRHRSQQQPRQRSVVRSTRIEATSNETETKPKGTLVNSYSPAPPTSSSAAFLSTAQAKDSPQSTPSETVKVVHSKRLTKSINRPATSEMDTPVPPQPYPGSVNYNFNANPGVLGNVLNIPIGILRTIQESLTGIEASKAGSTSG